MTTIEHREGPEATAPDGDQTERQDDGVRPPTAPAGDGPVRRVAPWTPRRIGIVAGVWLVMTAICFGLVAYGLGPLLESREQRALLTEIRDGIATAVGERESLFGSDERPRAAELGEPVAILQIPKLGLQQIVAEGADPERTQDGPGHVPGTAGPGQPGNSAVVARRYGFGAPFNDLASLRDGDDIVISTTQGQSLYKVRSVGQHDMDSADIYAPSRDDRLTLVTSASWVPWESTQAQVVVAVMEGLPYPAAPQGARSVLQDGRHGDGNALALVVLYAALFAAAAAAAVLLYRRWLSMSTYLLTAPVMLALIVLTAEAATRLLPAWT